MEKQISTQTIYDGKVVKLIKDEVELDDGTRSYREIVCHHGGACIALKRQDGKYFMVKQYRYSQSEDMLEFCAGKLNEGEDPLEAVIRETEEELGYRTKNLKSLGYMIPTCGYSSEKIYLYYGEAAEYVGGHLDEDERLDVYAYTFDEIKAMIMQGQIIDAKTICIMYRLEMENINE